MKLKGLRRAAGKRKKGKQGQGKKVKEKSKQGQGKKTAERK